MFETLSNCFESWQQRCSYFEEWVTGNSMMLNTDLVSVKRWQHHLQHTQKENSIPLFIFCVMIKPIEIHRGNDSSVCTIGFGSLQTASILCQILLNHVGQTER